MNATTRPYADRQDGVDGSADLGTIILDMDGTLLDLHFDDQVWNYALPARLAERHGYSLATAKTRVIETLNAARGTLSWYCLDHWSREFGLSLHLLEDELAQLVGVRAGTAEFLNFCHTDRRRCILATNAHPASLARKLRRTELERYFDIVVSAHELGVLKEDPRFWVRLAAAAQIEPGATLFVDDNAAVLSTARRFGIRHVFGIRYPSSSGGVRSYESFASVNELTELIPWLRSREFYSLRTFEQRV